MKKKKRRISTISILLSIMMLTVQIPVPVAADDNTVDQQNTSVSEELPEQKDEEISAAGQMPESSQEERTDEGAAGDSVLEERETEDASIPTGDGTAETEAAESEPQLPQDTDDSEMPDEDALFEEVSVLAAEGDDSEAEASVLEASVSASLFAGARYTDGKYVWTANGSAAGHRFSYRISYDIKKTGTLAEEAIQIRIPKQILKDRNGLHADGYELSIPSREEVAHDTEGISSEVYFAYYEETEEETGEEEIVIYNFRPIEDHDTFYGYIELAYYTSKPTFAYPDMEASDPFQAEMTVGEFDEKTEDIPVYIDTHVTLQSTEKRYPTLVKTWDETWGSAPEDADDYWYLLWTVASVIDEHTTQSYRLTLKDEVKTSDMEIVGYRMSGETKFTADENDRTVTERSEQTLTRARYDTVLTRIPKSVYEPLEKWTVTNSVTVTATPERGKDEATTAASTRSFTYQKPKFQDPDGYFNTWKRADGAYREFEKYDHNIYTGTGGYSVFRPLTIRAGEYSRYDLNDFWRDGTLTSYNGLDYAVWVCGYPYVWTREEGAAANDPEAYFKVPVRYELTDEKVYLSNDASEETEGTLLGAGDYQITSIQYNVIVNDAYFDEDSQIFRSTPVTWQEGDVLYLYGRFADTKEGEWELLGTRDYYNDIWQAEGSRTRSMTEKEIVPEEGCITYRAVMENAHYYTVIGTVVNLELLKSETVMRLADNENSIILKNCNEGNLYVQEPGAQDEEKDEKGYVLRLSIPKYDYDYARVSQRDSNLVKRVVATANNNKKARFTISWRIDQKETVTSGEDGVTQDRLQESGVFYDLLPAGAIVDRNSIAVRSDSGFLASNAYTMQQVPNYKNTGRTLLIVRIKEPGTNYSLYYDTFHAWESIKDFGSDVYNPIAYQTGNEDIAHGSADDGGALRESALMSGLDAENDGNRFIYAQENFDIAAMYAASAGLSKRVREERDAVFTNDTVTSPNGDYIYRLRYSTNSGMQVGNLVFVDNLENAQKDGVGSQWHGTLSSVNTSQLKASGVRPVVYLSREVMEMPEIDDETDYAEKIEDFLRDSRWMAEEEFVAAYGSLAAAKAVAVDARTGEDGNPFILEQESSLVVYLYRKAPDSLEDESNTYPETYNDVFLLGKDAQINVPFCYQQGPTTVRYRVTADLNLHKVSSEDTSESIAGVSFRLWGTSDYGNPVDRILTTDRTGDLCFDEVEKGIYTLQEYQAPMDWQLDVTEHRVEIDNAGHLWIDGEECNILTLTDKPRVHADITFYKREQMPEGVDLKKAIPDTTFRISGTSDYGNDITLVAKSNDLGLVIFRNLELGTYELTETGPNPEYLENDTVYTLTVNENGSVRITSEEGELELDDTIPVIYNIPRYWDFSIRKVDAENNSRWLEGAAFHLSGTSDFGTEVDMDVDSNENGRADFVHLEKGSYVLKETAAPTGLGSDGKKTENGTLNYLTDDTEHIVTIKEDGTVTIDGLEKNEFEEYMFPNPRALDGEIIIYKKWVDTAEDGERPVPVIRMHTEDEQLIHGVTVTKEWEGDIQEDRPDDIQVHLLKTGRKVDGYTIVDYIESKSDAYIDTGYYPTGGTTVETIFAFPTLPGRLSVFGARNAANSNGAIYMLYDGWDYYQAKALKAMYGASRNVVNSQASTSVTVGKRYSAVMSPSQTVITAAEDKSDVYYSVAYPQASFTVNRTMYICAVNTRDGFVPTNIRIYSFRIYDDSNHLVRDYIPVINPEGVYGLYDLVGSRFYGSITSQPFTGPEASVELTQVSVSEEGGWEKNGNTWTYTFDVLVDGESQYYVYEEPVNGYSSSAGGEDNRISVESGRATIKNTYVPVNGEFEYTGEAQEWTAPSTGWYKLEAWGAQGGNSLTSANGQWPVNCKDQQEYQNNLITAEGGKGGYSYTYVYLEAGEKVTVAVGGAGKSFVYEKYYTGSEHTKRYIYDNVTGEITSASNAATVAGGFNGGGGAMFPDANGYSWQGAGGGATSFQLGEKKGTGELKNYNGDRGNVLLVAGGGGGSGFYQHPESRQFWHHGYGGYGGGLESGGNYDHASGSANISTAYGSTQNSSGGGVNRFLTGSFGQGACVSTWGNGGGGGYWGGTSTGLQGGAGGSGYLNMTRTESGATIAGNQEFRDPSGQEETGHSGNGYARITRVVAPGIERTVSETRAAAKRTVKAAKAAAKAASSGSDYVTADKGWTKVDANTWKYAFHVFNDNATYYVTEDELEGYTSPAMGASIKLDGSYAKSLVVTNTSTRSYGSLLVRKTVEGVSGSTQKFHFTVTLTGEHIPSGRQVMDGLVFTGGKAQFSLADGEERRISGIPVGTQYKVEEEANENFTVSAEGENGEIDEEESTAVFVNTYHPPVIDPVDITLKKQVTGIVENPEEEFLFYVYFANLENLMEYTMSDGTKFRSNEKGQANLQISLRADQELKFLRIPVGASYQMVEAAGDYTASYRITDSNNASSGSILSSAGANTKANAQLSTAAETAEEGEQITVTFTNRIARTVNLTLEKNVEEFDNGEEFEFTVLFANMEEGTEFYSDRLGRIYADADGTAEKTVVLRNGEKVTFRDVPVGVTYMVTEGASDHYIASYKITGTNVSSPKGENERGGKALAFPEPETVHEGEDISVIYTNKPWKSTLTLSKEVTGNMGDKSREFVFTITATQFETPVEGTFSAKRTLGENTKEETVTFAEGKAEVKLSHGETLVVDGLMVGTEYRISEEADGYTVTKTGEEDTIKADGKSVAKFVNNRTVAVPTGADLGRTAIYFGIAAMMGAAAAIGLLLGKRRRRS